MTANQKFIPILFLFIGLVVGFSGAQLFAEKAMMSYKTALKQRAMEAGMMLEPEAQVKELSGSITSIDGNVLTISLVHPKDIFGDPLLDERTVTVGSASVIAILTQKDGAVFQREMNAFQSALQAQKSETMAESGKSLVSPQLFSKEVAAVSALKVGQVVNITTLENVKDQKKFTALTVDIMPTPTAMGISGQSGKSGQ